MMRPAQGNPPTLEWVSVGQLSVDPAYQRSLEAKSSKRLIREIAKAWHWGLCQPLAVSRREDGSLYVMDGQHRLAAAIERGDVPHLPCVITRHDSVAAEADAFVKLNRQRRALGSVDVFKASVAAGTESAVEVEAMIKAAGLTIAPHSNYNVWKPGMIYCVPGVTAAYRRFGKQIASAALVALAEAFPGQVLQYAGQLFRGIVGVYATLGKDAGFDPDAFIERLAANGQSQWRRKAAEHTARTGEGRDRAMVAVMADAYRRIQAAA